MGTHTRVSLNCPNCGKVLLSNSTVNNVYSGYGDNTIICPFCKKPFRLNSIAEPVRAGWSSLNVVTNAEYRLSAMRVYTTDDALKNAEEQIKKHGKAKVLVQNNYAFEHSLCESIQRAMLDKESLRVLNATFIAEIPSSVDKVFVPYQQYWNAYAKACEAYRNKVQTSVLDFWRDSIISFDGYIKETETNPKKGLIVSDRISDSLKYYPCCWLIYHKMRYATHFEAYAGDKHLKYPVNIMHEVLKDYEDQILEKLFIANLEYDFIPPREEDEPVVFRHNAEIARTLENGRLVEKRLSSTPRIRRRTSSPGHPRDQEISRIPSFSDEIIKPNSNASASTDSKSQPKAKKSLFQRFKIRERTANEASSMYAKDLREIKRLLDEGLITEEDYNAKKKQILGL